jgi:hypothetical protein
MHFQFIVAPPTPTLTPPAPPATETPAELLRQLLDVQREQLGVMQASATQAEGNSARWQAFFGRWREDFPNLPASLREVLPSVERAYMRLMDEMVRHLKDEESASLDDDFTLGEFLDRYAIRASQIGTILNMFGQMADAAREE